MPAHPGEGHADARFNHRNRLCSLGKHAGRTSADEITLFDDTGVALQDLAVASGAVDLALV
ncbi:hypothetical protein RJJ65_30725 [Rhizobium hidalgonense]|uniref:Uncharacterized protein n=1 Tax=Rhizobium hidalgonense TaxID=1538159 RepID=A0AAJ2GVZ5_9HYPH|nr:hypothetical protein [Rhizobium hidalgonense]MDR9776947.1 hypothetical protein [Rhizobium hidalgonense]MDR9820681.1 hypothetical protein [Rhizobium hidalgonense]